ncbi:hypothetical protein D3C86_1235910 [compost metagenome]
MQCTVLGPHVVVPAAQQHHHLVRDLQLILQVNAKAMLAVAALLPWQGHDISRLINRIVDIDGGKIAAQTVAVVGRARVIEARQKGVRDGARLEFLLDVGVDRLHCGAVIEAARRTRHSPLRCRIHVALQQHVAHVQVGIVIAHRLAKLQRVVEGMFDQHGHRGGLHIEAIVIRLAQKAMTRNLAVRVGP